MPNKVRWVIKFVKKSNPLPSTIRHGRAATSASSKNITQLLAWKVETAALFILASVKIFSHNNTI